MNPVKCSPKVLVVLEGANDIEFLLRLSQRLHAPSPEIPALPELQAEGRIIFVPTGGGNFQEWANRFAGLGLPGISFVGS